MKQIYKILKLITVILLQNILVFGYNLTELQLTDKITIRYEVLDNFFEIYMEVQCQVTSWCAIGFGDSMVNADIIRIRKDNQNNIIVDDMYSKKYDMPVIDEFSDLMVLAGTYDSTSITGIFKRNIKPIDSQDTILKLGEKIDMIWAISNDQVTNKHQSSGIATPIFYSNLGEFDCHYRCLYCRGPLADQCLSCRAQSEFLNQGFCQAVNMTELAVSKQIEGNITISWGYPQEFYIDFILETPMFGFFGLLFGNSFDNTDVIMFQVKQYYDELTKIKHKRVEIYDMYSSNKLSTPDYDTVLRGYDNNNMMGYIIDEEEQQIKIKFRRKMDTGDIFDYDFSKTNTQMMYVKHDSDNKLKQYLDSVNSAVSFELDLSQVTQIKEDTWWKEVVRKSHTLFLFILWGPMTDFSIVIVRYFKGIQSYLRIHGLIFICVNIMTVLLVSFMIDVQWSELENLDQKGKEIYLVHFIFGVIILAIIFAQHILGVILKVGIESQRKKLNVNSIKKIHRILGMTLYLFTKTSLILGVYLWEDEYYGRLEGEKYWYTIGMSLYYTCLVLLFSFIEIFYRSEPDLSKNKRRIVYKELSEADQYDKIMNDLNNGVQMAEVVDKYKDVVYCILENRVYDITDISHPGGQFIVENVKGREIGRFFYGGYMLEQFTQSTHSHRVYAQNYLNKLYIGTIDNSLYNPIEMVEEVNVEVQKFREDPQPSNVWCLIKDEDCDPPKPVKFSTNCKIFEFQSPYYKVKNFLPGVHYFGRHFTLQPQGGAILVDKRQYSMIMCFQKECIRFRIAIVKYFKQKMFNLENNINDDNIMDDIDYDFDNPDLYSDSISFIIKKMPKSRIQKGFSHFIYNTGQSFFELQGPFGQGLELNQYSKGTHFIFTGGTGVLPFLDLFDYLIRKCIHNILADKISLEEADKINPFEENYCDDFPIDFKIVLYGAFANVDEFIGYKIIADLYEISRYYNLDIFDCVINFKYGGPEQQNILPTTTSRFTQTFIRNQIQEKGAPSKVYICGPPKMNKNVYNDCQKIGIPKSKLFYV